MKLDKLSLALIASIGLLSFSLSSNAQPTNGAIPGARKAMRGGAEAQFARISEELKLTDEQKPKVKAILEEQNKKRMELRAEATPDRAKMKALQEETSKKMKEVLTPDQFSKYEQFMKDHRPGAPGAAGQEGGNPSKHKKNTDK